jgi:hypothetical protein
MRPDETAVLTILVNAGPENTCENLKESQMARRRDSDRDLDGYNTPTNPLEQTDLISSDSNPRI